MTTLFEDIIERKNVEYENSQAKKTRKKEVYELFGKVVEEHRGELEKYFKEVELSYFKKDLEIRDRHYNIAFNSMKELLHIGYKANSTGVSNGITISFSYNDNNSKLVGIFKNAIRTLVSLAYNPRNYSCQ